MNILKLVIGNTASQVVARLISSATGFLVTILVARSYGIVGYSDLAKVMAFVTLFYLIIDLGANALFLQMEKTDQKLQDLFSFRLFVAGILFVLLSLCVGFLPYSKELTSGYSPLVKTGILLFAFSYFSRAVVFSSAAFFQQKFLYSRVALASLGSSLAVILSVVFVALNHLSILWVVGAYLLGGFIEAIMSLFFARSVIVWSFPSLLFFRKLFWSTLPLTLLLFLNLLYFRVDMILLSFFQKASAVGIYDFAYKFFDFLIALPLFLSNSLYPLLLRAEKNSRIQVKNISLYTILFFGLGLLLIPFVWTLSPLLSFVKQDFAPSIAVLRILSLSLPIFFATNILQWIFITKKKQTILVAVYGISLVINIILNLMFIPAYSYTASAVITGFSELLILVAMLIFVVFNKL